MDMREKLIRFESNLVIFDLHACFQVSFTTVYSTVGMTINGTAINGSGRILMKIFPDPRRTSTVAIEKKFIGSMPIQYFLSPVHHSIVLILL